jgi:hypothetical protein
LFQVGSIVELNNQAKHAVWNRMADRHRVHLIFDYIEEGYHPRTVYWLPRDITTTEQQVTATVSLNNLKINKEEDSTKQSEKVEIYSIPRLQLQPNEVVYQTRRTIDLARESVLESKEGEANISKERICSNRVIPSFIIIGAQKSGTTSLYEYLMQLPLLLRGKRRETHYFDWFAFVFCLIYIILYV